MPTEHPSRPQVQGRRALGGLTTNSISPYQAFATGVCGDGGGLFGFPGFGPGTNSAISSYEAFTNGMGIGLISNVRQMLSWGYAKYGTVQTLVDQPVDDAFSKGIIIKSRELDDDDMEELLESLSANRRIQQYMQAEKWKRLNGGAGLVIATDGDPRAPFDIAEIQQGGNYTLIPVDRFELTSYRLGINGYAIPAPYNYYGEELDWSRVIRFQGIEAPSQIRPLLQGWGMSELERCLREINFYLKLERVCYELVDEAKVDKYKLFGLNDLLGDGEGLQKAIMRVQFGNLIKNFKNALVLDSQDEHEVTTNTFAGLADLLEQGRIGLAGALRIPVHKLFGTAATGLNAGGEDALENYNTLVTSGTREPSKPVLKDIITMECQLLWGTTPSIKVDFPPLREADPVQEEQVMTSKQNRAVQLRGLDQIDPQEMDQILHKEGLLDIETSVGAGREPAPMGAGGEDEEGPKGKPDQTRNSREDRRAKYSWLRGQSRRARRMDRTLRMAA